MSFEMRAIGVVESPYTDIDSVPVQSLLNPDVQGRLRVFDEFVAGLSGLEDFDFAHVLWVLHAGQVGPTDWRNAAEVLRPTPLLLTGTGRRIGVCATRYPVRPNRIALSLIRIKSIAGGVIEFSGVDMIDRTPVLDIKPWVPALDIPNPPAGGEFRTGWYAEVDLQSITPAAVTQGKRRRPPSPKRSSHAAERS